MDDVHMDDVGDGPENAHPKFAVLMRQLEAIADKHHAEAKQCVASFFGQKDWRPQPRCPNFESPSIDKGATLVGKSSHFHTKGLAKTSPVFPSETTEGAWQQKTSHTSHNDAWQSNVGHVTSVETVTSENAEKATGMKDGCFNSAPARLAWDDLPAIATSECEARSVPEPLPNSIVPTEPCTAWMDTSGTKTQHSLNTSASKTEQTVVTTLAVPGKQANKRARQTAVNTKNFLIASKRQDMIEHQTRLQRLVTSQVFEWITGGAILLNAVFIGYQSQVVAERARSSAASGTPPSEYAPTDFAVLQFVFCLGFTAELIMRWSADGFLQFFRTSDRGWNSFDTVVVFLGQIDVVATMWPYFSRQSSMKNTSMLRVMRVIRVVRVGRVIRIMRFFRELRMMIYALLGSLKPLCWALLLLVMMFFIFGISINSGVVEYLNDTETWLEASNAQLINSFGTIDASILTLFMAMSGGRDWGDTYILLENVFWLYKLAFLLFICFAIFAVVNIVTGIFVDSATQANREDRDVLIQEEATVRERYLASMREIFQEMDDEDKGSLTAEDFQSKLNDSRVMTYFEALKLDVSDAKKLFMLLDHDKSGEIDIDEFLMGCQKLKGESRALDIAIMQYEVRWIAGIVVDMERMVSRLCDQSRVSSEIGKKSV